MLSIYRVSAEPLAGIHRRGPSLSGARNQRTGVSRIALATTLRLACASPVASINSTRQLPWKGKTPSEIHCEALTCWFTTRVLVPTTPAEKI
jgi:hypothetical protein